MNRISVLILALLFVIGNSCSKDQETQSFSIITIEDAQAVLDFHNEVRNDVNVAELEWSDELAQYAKEWAEILVKNYDGELKHRSSLGRNDKGYGDNLYWSSSSSATELDATEAWYSEIENYSYEPISNENYQGTGHYTQMVWQNTQKVGMGKAETSTGAIVIVANYYPQGNVIGQKPY